MSLKTLNLGIQASSFADFFKFQILLTVNDETGKTFTIPINNGGEGYTHNFTVNWGDGSPNNFITSYNDVNRTHIYNDIGIYDITLMGVCEYFAFQNINENNSLIKITKMLSFTGDMGFKELNFYGCSNLDTIIPLNSFASLANLTRMFCSCSALTSIPNNMFKKCTEVVVASSTFEDCTGIVTLPVDLFRYQTKVTEFQSTFLRCTGLTTIPSDLFKYNIEVTSFSQCFWNCNNINLISIPNGLFDTNIKATNFTYTFGSCDGLQSIPTNLFKYNVLVTTFYGTFFGCHGLVHELDGNMFLYNTIVEDFTSTFQNCEKITGSGWGSGNVPETVVGTIIYNAEHQPTPPTETTYCFKDCDALTVESGLPIPNAWK